VPSGLILAFLISSGCGGGGSQPQITRTSPSQDFSLTLSTNSLSVPQGGTSSPVNVLVNGQNGFAGTVQITLSDLPTGVVSNPASPFNIAAGENTAVLFGAAPNAGTGSFTITAQATSGTLSHSAGFSLAVQSSVGYTAQVYSNPALKGEPAPYKFLAYDQKRQLLYLSAPSQIDIFDLQAAVFKPAGLTLNCPSFKSPGPCPDDDVRGLALTPDGSQLVAADFGSQNVYLLDPDTPNTPAIATSLAASGYNPARVAATSVQTVFVALSAEATSSGTCASCLSQLDLTTSPPTVQPAPQPAVTTVTGSPLLQADAAGDRVFLSFATPPGGPVGIWDPTRTDFKMSVTSEIASDLSAAADGTMFATVNGGMIEIRSVDSSLQSTVVSTFAAPDLEPVPGRVSVPGIAMHPSGALVYQPFRAGPAPAAPSATGVQSGVDILDAHTGKLRLRIFLPEPLAMLASDIDGLHGNFLAIDENGQKIFALTTSGLTVVQLTNVPLGIGTVLPAAGSASGGTTLTIRGSGFQTGTTVTIGGKTANVIFKDMNTLTVVTPSVTAGPQQIVVTNPDGERVTLDAAFAAD
jgi:IPT/TIG domain-containing protein